MRNSLREATELIRRLGVNLRGKDLLNFANCLRLVRDSEIYREERTDKWQVSLYSD